MRLHLAAVDFGGDVRWAEQVMGLWVREMKWHDLPTEGERQDIARQARLLDAYARDLTRIHSQISEQKKLRIDTEDEIHRLSNSAGNWVSGLAGQVGKLNENLTAIDNSIRVLEEDLRMIGDNRAVIRREQNATEKALRGRAYSRMAIKAGEYADRAWKEWLASCPVPDLLMPVVLNESMVVDGVRAMIEWVVEGSQSFDPAPAQLVTTAAGDVEVQDLNGISFITRPVMVVPVTAVVQRPDGSMTPYQPAPPVPEANIKALPKTLSGGLGRASEADIEALLGVVVG